MHIDEYQKQALTTAIYPDTAHITYPALGLANEAGEVLGVVKKVMRDHGKWTPEAIEQAKKELGDVLWYIAVLASDLGLSLSSIAGHNLDKLKSRAERGTLKGDGDDR